MRSFPAVLAAAALGSAVLAPARAQDAAIAADPASDQASTEAVSVAHLPVATYIDQQNANTLPLKPKTTYTFGRLTTFTCTASCTVEIAAMVEAGAATAANNSWVICADIDGKTGSLRCPFQGTLPTDQSFVVGNYTWSAPLAAGTHTAQPTLLVETGRARIAFYHVAYRVYQP